MPLDKLPISRRKLLVLASLLYPITSVSAINLRNAEFDVIVVGSGAAGLSAALSAAEYGQKVLILEKEDFIGGDTLVCGGYFNAAETDIQRANAISDSPYQFYTQMMQAARYGNSESLAKTLTEESAHALEWLEKYGVRFENKTYQIYGSVYPRCHKPILPKGTAYIQSLSKACLEKGVEIKTHMKVVDLLVSPSNRVNGVVVIGRSGLSQEITASKGVILAAGGFGANKAMLKKYAPKMENLMVDSSAGATGEVLEAAQRIGAQLVNMSNIECIPEGADSHEQSIRLYVISKGIVFVNEDGNRFVDEKASRSVLSEALLKQFPKKCFTIVDDLNVKTLDKLQRKNLYRAYFAKRVNRADTLETLAKQLGMNPQALLNSIQQMPTEYRPKHAPYWAAEMNLWIHYTLGGLKIDAQSHCLDINNRPIPGLYAAGQITGNVHGTDRLGGNGLTDAVVFGRIAGKSISSL